MRFPIQNPLFQVSWRIWLACTSLVSICKKVCLNSTRKGKQVKDFHTHSIVLCSNKNIFLMLCYLWIWMYRDDVFVLRQIWIFGFSKCTLWQLLSERGQNSGQFQFGGAARQDQKPLLTCERSRNWCKNRDNFCRLLYKLNTIQPATRTTDHGKLSFDWEGFCWWSLAILVIHKN